MTNRTDRTYRHEYKYLISYGQKQILTTRMSSIFTMDQHTRDGEYNIRSLYFDSIDNQCYYQNEDGTDPRAKFRLRLYNHDGSFVKLEKKSKCKGMTGKESCSVDRNLIDVLCSGHVNQGIANSPLQSELITLIQTQGYRPSVIVEYTRVPYIYKLGNVRVTFDEGIASSNDFSAFLSEKVKKRLILPEGHLLMEVKYDAFIPDYLYNLLQLNELRQTSFSKFYLCKKYNMYE